MTDHAELLERLLAIKAQVDADELHEDLALEDALHDEHPWRVIGALLDELGRECVWVKTTSNNGSHYTNNCDPDITRSVISISKFCPDCGGKVRVQSDG